MTSEKSELAMETLVRSSRNSIPYSTKGRKALQPVQRPSSGNQGITVLSDESKDALHKDKNEKMKLYKKTDVRDIVGKENTSAKNTDGSSSDSNISKLRKPQLKSKMPGRVKKTVSGKKSKTPKGSSNQPKIAFKPAEKCDEEVSPGYEFLIADPPAGNETLSQEELYWKEIAEQHDLSLQFTLFENEKLQNELAALRKENERLLSAVEDGARLADMLEECREAVEEEEDVE